MISSMVIVRRQWVEHERLVFPLTQVPLEMLQSPQLGRILGSLFRKPLLWGGDRAALDRTEHARAACLFQLHP